jgi:chemotaxis response regulator CheB
LYTVHWDKQQARVEMTSTMADTHAFIAEHNPDLVIVDHDDKTINQADFLSRFVTGDRPMKVVLVSLTASEPVVIYNRMQLSASQAEDWLANPWDE